MNRQKRAEIARMTTVMKLINQSGSFEDIGKFSWHYQWSCLKIGDVIGYLLQFVTIPASVF